MKRKLHLKSTFLTAMLFVGMSAWATEPVTTGFVTVYSNDFESGSSPWGWNNPGTIELKEETSGNHYMCFTRYTSGKNTYYNRSLLFSNTYTKYELTFKWFAKTVESKDNKLQIKFITDHTDASSIGNQYRYNDNNGTATYKLYLTNSSGNSDSNKTEMTNYTKSTSDPSSVADDFYTVKVASDGTNVRFTFTDPAGTSVTKDYTYNDNFQLGGVQLQSQTTSDYHYIDDVVLKVPSHTYTVNAVDDSDNILSELATGDAGESAQYSVTGLPKVVTKDGKYYVLNDGTVTNFATQSYTMGTENETKSIIYTEDASIVYFCELEDLSSTSEVTGNYSGGKGAAIKGGGISSIITLPAGKYVATGAFCNDANNRGMYLRTSNSNNSGNIIVYTGGSYWTGEHSTDEFTLDASTAVYVTGYTASGSSVNQSATLDYIIIRKTAELATITSVGWATLYTAYPLDFSGVSGLTAYTATCSESTVTLTPVENVPANTGIVLKGAADTYNIPVIASSETDKGHLIGSATTATAYNAYDGYDLYMLAKHKTQDIVQFKKVKSGSIAAGKAFLKVAAGASALAPELDVVFADDNTTGINTVQGSGLMVNGYYDLQGRKVANPTKGLYIVNGKKVVIK